MLESNSVFYDVILFEDDAMEEHSPELRADVIRAVRACLELKREMQQYAQLVGLTFDPGIPNHPSTKSEPVEIDQP
jgi:hypothetical protein